LPSAIITTSKLVVWTAPRRGQHCADPCKGYRSLTSHQYLRQPLQAAVFFALFILGTRKRVCELFDADLIVGVIFFKLISYILFYYLLILSYGVHIVSSTPKCPTSILVF